MSRYILFCICFQSLVFGVSAMQQDNQIEKGLSERAQSTSKLLSPEQVKKARKNGGRIFSARDNKDNQKTPVTKTKSLPNFVRLQRSLSDLPPDYEMVQKSPSVKKKSDSFFQL
jgi:hypothetical protein